MTSIFGIPIRAYQLRALDTAVGVIRGLPGNMSDGDIHDALRTLVPVIKTRRLGTSEVVLIVFQTTMVPEHIYVGYAR